MNNNDYLKIYNDCLNKKYKNPDLEPLLNSLYILIQNAEDWVMRCSYFLCYPNGLDPIRSKIMRIYIAMIKKMIRKNKCEDFKNNINLAFDIRIDARLIPLYFNLLFFSDELFKKELKKDPNYIIRKESNYRYIINMLLINDGYYYQYKNNRLLESVRIALDYLRENKTECNDYIPSIILYCLMHEYSQEKYIEMLEYSFKYYDQLNDFINMYDDYHHMDELYDLVLKRIDANFDFNSIVIK